MTYNQIVTWTAFAILATFLFLTTDLLRTMMIRLFEMSVRMKTNGMSQPYIGTTWERIIDIDNDNDDDNNNQ